MTPYLQVWFSVLSLVLSIILIKVLDGPGFELHVFIWSRCKFSCLIHFSRSTDMKVMQHYVSQVLNSHPEWSHYHQFLLHHWSEKCNFCTNRFVCLKRRFWYIIWPPIFKFDFRYYLWSSVSSSSRFWMVLVLSSIFVSSQEVNFHVSFISLGQRTWKLCNMMCLKYSILIQNGLIIIKISFIICRRSLTFLPIDLSL